MSKIKTRDLEINNNLTMARSEGVGDNRGKTGKGQAQAQEHEWRLTGMDNGGCCLWGWEGWGRGDQWEKW